MPSKKVINVYIAMNESGAFVVSDNADDAAEFADNEFDENEDLRSVRLRIAMSPANGAQPPADVELELD